MPHLQMSRHRMPQHIFDHRHPIPRFIDRSGLHTSHRVTMPCTYTHTHIHTHRHHTHTSASYQHDIHIIISHATHIGIISHDIHRIISHHPHHMYTHMSSHLCQHASSRRCRSHSMCARVVVERSGRSRRLSNEAI